MSNESKYRIRAGRLGHEYAVLVTFENKEDIEPLTRVIRKGFEHFEKVRRQLKKAKELEKKQREKNRDFSYKEPL